MTETAPKNPASQTATEESENYFIFALSECFYALPAKVVHEVVYLPELKLLATASEEVVGVFDLRGNIIPVVDLKLRLQQTLKPYELNDCVIVLEIDKQIFGIIVNEIHDVGTAETVKDNQMLYSARFNNDYQQQLLAGSLKKDGIIITLLNPKALLQQDFIVDTAAKQTLERITFCPHADDKQREKFKARAESLKQQSLHTDSINYQALAVIMLHDEYFGVDLMSIKEFADIADIDDIVPIPCTPSHIIGFINLRGNVITLLDIRKVINLPCQNVQAEAKAIIVNYSDEFAVAIIVESILEVIYINPDDISAVPTSVSTVSGEYLTGEVLYQSKLLTLLDLNKILEKGDLLVEDNV
ncbi:MAG: hypothetical protein GQ569_13130 [Methylococcaceae bacterium]|nr:hypothetical protein [Methylococcaceae bacterium]